MRVEKRSDGWWYLPRYTTTWQWGGRTQDEAIENARSRMLLAANEPIETREVQP